MQPNKKNIKLWVDALRSGRYKQATSALRKKSFLSRAKFCCLGVACELYRQDTNDGKWVRTSSVPSRYEFSSGQYTTNGILTKNVSSWLGIESSDPRLSGETRASILNDIREFDFNFISNLIEKKYLLGDKNDTK